MRITVRPAIVLSFSSVVGRAVAFFVLAAVRGAVISAYVFVAFCYPLAHLRWLKLPVLALARLFDLPIAALGVLVPFLRTPFSFIRPMSFLGFDGAIDPRWALLAHMRAGILAYLILFHVPTFVRLTKQWRRRSSPPIAP
jgi:hypothetical protein